MLVFKGLCQRFKCVFLYRRSSVIIGFFYDERRKQHTDKSYSGKHCKYQTGTEIVIPSGGVCNSFPYHLTGKSNTCTHYISQGNICGYVHSVLLISAKYRDQCVVRSTVCGHKYIEQYHGHCKPYDIRYGFPSYRTTEYQYRKQSKRKCGVSHERYTFTEFAPAVIRHTCYPWVSHCIHNSAAGGDKTYDCQPDKRGTCHECDDTIFSGIRKIEID